MRHSLMAFLVTTALAGVAMKPADVALGDGHREGPDPELDAQLQATLAQHGFTGRIEETLPARLGRPINPDLADLGRLIFFDRILSLHNDTSCAACHGPAWGFGDSQSMAIGVGNNGVSGPDRAGARNQRRAPSVLNSAFYPRQMLNGRFESLSGDSFDNSLGFKFPAPEGLTKFPPNDPVIRLLVAAQAHLPPTDLVEMAGFTGTAGTIGPEFDQFDDGAGQTVPPADASGYRNEPIRAAVVARFNESAAYRPHFARAFGMRPLPPGGIDFPMIANALAEFQASLTFTNAPIDRFARGWRAAMTPAQKRGALLFFGRARCVECHAVAGGSNEMFSDFRNHVIGGAADRAGVRGRQGKREVRRPGRRRGLRRRAGHGRPRRPLRLPHLAVAQRERAAGVLPQRRVHAARGRHTPPSRRGRVLAPPTIPPSPVSTRTSGIAAGRRSRCWIGWTPSWPRRSP